MSDFHSLTGNPVEQPSGEVESRCGGGYSPPGLGKNSLVAFLIYYPLVKIAVPLNVWWKRCFPHTVQNLLKSIFTGKCEGIFPVVIVYNFSCKGLVEKKFRSDPWFFTELD